jgi:hypothetical protein
LFSGWLNVVEIAFGVAVALSVVVFVYQTCVYLYENSRRRKFPRR